MDGARLSFILLAALSAGGCTVMLDGDAVRFVGFVRPAGTVAVSITVDDTANKVYEPGDLAWKGSYAYDAAAREVALDTTWTGPFPPLYDDGPWTTGGHEPEGSVAGDHKWGMTIFVRPGAAPIAFEYGIIDQTLGADSWIWPRGLNGSFVVPANATSDIVAAGTSFPAFGTTDLKLTIDKNNLAAGTWTAPPVYVKGTFCAWSLLVLQDDGLGADAAPGDGIYTFRLSDWIGPGKSCPHFGLLSSGDIVDFNFVLGTAVYKILGVAPTTGLTAEVKAAGAGSWGTVTISNPSSGDDRIVVP
jgi:hypothetical protein